MKDGCIAFVAGLIGVALVEYGEFFLKAWIAVEVFCWVTGVCTP